MSMFGSSAKEQIYQELKYIYENDYKNDWNDPEYQMSFVLDVLYVLQTMFGE